MERHVCLVPQSRAQVHGQEVWAIRHALHRQRRRENHHQHAAGAHEQAKATQCAVRWQVPSRGGEDAPARKAEKASNQERVARPTAENDLQRLEECEAIPRHYRPADCRVRPRLRRGHALRLPGVRAQRSTHHPTARAHLRLDLCSRGEQHRRQRRGDDEHCHRDVKRRFGRHKHGHLTRHCALQSPRGPAWKAPTAT